MAVKPRQSSTNQPNPSGLSSTGHQSPAESSSRKSKPSRLSNTGHQSPRQASPRKSAGIGPTSPRTPSSPEKLPESNLGISTPEGSKARAPPRNPRSASASASTFPADCRAASKPPTPQHPSASNITPPATDLQLPAAHPTAPHHSVAVCSPRVQHLKGDFTDTQSSSPRTRRVSVADQLIPVSPRGMSADDQTQPSAAERVVVADMTAPSSARRMGMADQVMQDQRAWTGVDQEIPSTARRVTAVDQTLPLSARRVSVADQLIPLSSRRNSGVGMLSEPEPGAAFYTPRYTFHSPLTPRASQVGEQLASCAAISVQGIPGQLYQQGYSSTQEGPGQSMHPRSPHQVRHSHTGLVGDTNGSLSPRGIPRHSLPQSLTHSEHSMSPRQRTVYRSPRHSSPEHISTRHSSPRASKLGQAYGMASPPRSPKPPGSMRHAAAQGRPQPIHTARSPRSRGLQLPSDSIGPRSPGSPKSPSWVPKLQLQQQTPSAINSYDEPAGSPHSNHQSTHRSSGANGHASPHANMSRRGGPSETLEYAASSSTLPTHVGLPSSRNPLMQPGLQHDDSAQNGKLASNAGAGAAHASVWSSELVHPVQYGQAAFSPASDAQPIGPQANAMAAAVNDARPHAAWEHSKSHHPLLKHTAGSSQQFQKIGVQCVAMGITGPLPAHVAHSPLITSKHHQVLWNEWQAAGGLGDANCRPHTEQLHIRNQRKQSSLGVRQQERETAEGLMDPLLYDEIVMLAQLSEGRLGHHYVSPKQWDRAINALKQEVDRPATS